MSDANGFPRLIQDYFGWLAISVLALGRRTGMLDAVLEGPVTADELAVRAGVDRRNAGAWLAAMTAHGYLTHAAGVFTMPEAEVQAFRAFPYDLAAILDFAQRAAGVLPEVEKAIRSGAGIAPAVFHERLGDCVGRIPARFYEMVTEGWLEQAGVAGVLRGGGSLLELAPGRGGALLHLASRFPRGRFLGVDLDVASVEAANADAASRGLGNARFAVGDVRALGGHGLHDVVLVIDAFHHFGDPAAVLRSVRDALRPGGRLVVAESTASGDLDRDVAGPFARILFGSNLLYCMQEGLHGGGAGLGTWFGTANYEKLLADAGFTGVGHVDTESGFTLVTGIAG